MLVDLQDERVWFTAGVTLAHTVPLLFAYVFYFICDNTALRKFRVRFVVF